MISFRSILAAIIRGYIGDLCRMAVQGEPDAELKELLAGVESNQMAARKPIRAGALGNDIYISAGARLWRRPRAASRLNLSRMEWA